MRSSFPIVEPTGNIRRQSSGSQILEPWHRHLACVETGRPAW